LVFPIIFYQEVTTEEEEDLSTYNYPIFTPGGIGSSDTDVQTVQTRSITIETGETLQPIAFENNVTNGTPITLHELFDNTTNIQSESGKTAKIILFIEGNTNNLTLNIRSSVTADTADGTILKAVNNSNLDSSAFLTVDDISLLSNGFLTVEVTITSGVIDIRGGMIIREA